MDASVDRHIVLLVGAAGVGKTSLLRRLGASDPSANPSLEDEEGGEHQLLSVHGNLRSHGGKHIPVTFVEVGAGTTPKEQYLKRASAILCVIDVTDRETLEPVRHTLGAFAHTRRHDLTPIVVGNKIDLIPKEKRTRHHTTFSEQAKEWGLLHYVALEAAKHVSYVTVSAHTGEHCDTLLEKLTFLMPDVPPPMPKEGEELHTWCNLL